ncbi:MAG: anthranilate phosphoribosyltransferase, partial [Alphaproteobacteria bacterium]|nr:anthranilate phosphoribosyltransferase [Alphaproteobacteria bacterium]
SGENIMNSSSENWKSFMATLCDENAATEKRSTMLRSVTPDDITGTMLADCAKYLLQRAVPLNLGDDKTIDICGTGGDKSHDNVKTFNISTATAFVLAAGGVDVIKHGNKAVSSLSGSSDVLEALDITICTTPEQAQEQYTQNRLCFIAAPAFHPALKSLAPIRKALDRPTFINLLGPLCNPAATKRQVIGVFDPAFLRPIAEAAQILGKTDLMTVHGDDGLDEISISAPTQICHLKDGKIIQKKIIPEEAGVETYPVEKLRGGSAGENAEIIRSVFSNQNKPATESVCFNAAAGFVVAGKSTDLKEGVLLARQTITDGLALKKLSEMQE